MAGGYKVDAIAEYFKENEVPFDVRIVTESEPLGTGGALGNCRDVISGTFACLNGDIISSLNMQQGIDLQQKNGGVGTLALWEVEDPTRFGIVGIDKANRITRFKEKPKENEVFSNLINAGSYLFEDDIFSYIPKGKCSLEREVFPVLAEEKKLNGYAFEGYFIDAGTPESWSMGVQACIANQRWKSGSRKGTNWHADSSVQIGETCNVEHTMLAKRTKIDDSVLSRCSLLDGVRIKERSILNNTMICKDSIIGRDCRLANVVVDHNSVIPDGTILEDAQWPIQ